MRHFLLLVAMCVGSVATAQQYHPLAGKCKFGTVHVEKNVIRITGHETWAATGTIRGVYVHLVWVNQSDLRVAQGAYRIEGRTLQGCWGWAEDVTIDGDDICGHIQPERIVVE